MDCPHCGNESPTGARFCLNCGARLALACSQCSTALPPHAKFCFACGQRVEPLPALPAERPLEDSNRRLRRLVPSEFAERLLSTRGQASRERRTVTILFSDVIGSTAMAEGLDPEEWTEVMEGAFDVLIEPIYRYEGTLARLMGDGVLAFFGAPISHEDDPERACRAALDIISGAREYAVRLEAEREIRGFNVRVGIHTGLVVVGEVGSDLRVEYTVMGDSVNLASRLEDNAPPGGILISHETYRHVRGVFDVLAQEPLAVKGRAEQALTYLVQRAKPRAFRIPLRGVEGIETRTIGREAELKHLQDAFYTAMKDGEFQFVTISGEVGVGKSRLLHEFETWSELLPEQFYYFQGRAYPLMQNQPYGLIRDLISFRFQIRDSDAPAEVREKLEAGIRGALGGENDRQAEEQVAARAHLIGRLVGFELGESPHREGTQDDAQTIRDRALASLTEHFEAMAVQSPVLILLEDLHWADDSSLDALNRLAHTLKNRSVMIACTARPVLFERRPHWGEGQPFYSRLELQLLSRWDSRRLVAEILQRVDDVPDAFRELVVSNAEGNPFFIEELIKNLVEDAVILKGKERWSLEPSWMAGIRVPPTLTSVLQARLDRLPLDERTVLQQASVVGRLFWDRAVARISRAAGDEGERSDVEEKLSSLREREMVFRRETSTFAEAREYVFKHALLREVTYESVLMRQRRAYHGLVADWLLEQSGERAEEHTSLIADHLELAGRQAEAIDYLLQAGDRARGLYAHREAQRAYERALGHLLEQGDDERAARTLMKLGLVHTAVFRPDEAQDAYQQAFALWEPLAASTEQPGPEERSAVLRFAMLKAPTLDPGMMEDEASVCIAGQLFEGLVGIDPDQNVLPAVAARWEVYDGGTHYLFRLREGLRWSDGAPLTAGDFEYAWKRNLAPASRSPSAHFLYPLKNARAYAEGALENCDEVGVEALDDVILEARLEGPTAYLPHLLAHPVAYPQPQSVLERWGSSWTEPEHLVSNGAFQLAELRGGEQLVLRRNPYYHGRFPGNVERVECPIFSEYGPVLDAYAAGSLDGVSMIMSDPGTNERARAAFGRELVFTPQPSTFFLAFRTDCPPFDDSRVRRAFVHAVDREALARDALKGQYLPGTGGFLPPGMPGHSAGIGLAYDPGRARRLLAEAGYPHGQRFPEITWLYSGSADNPVVPVLRRAWHENIGLHLRAEGLEWAEFFERRQCDPAHLALGGWLADYPDPDSLLRAVFHSTEGFAPGRWRNADFDALVEEAARVADHRRRMELYRKADRLLVADEVAVMPLGHTQGRILLKPWVRAPRVPQYQMRFKAFVLEERDAM